MRSHAHEFAQYRAIDSVGYLLRRAHKLGVVLAEDAFVGEELSFTQWIALIQLRDGLVDTCGALARRLDHDSGATTRMIDQLAARGLVLRQRSDTDRRVVRLALTEAGRAAAERLIPRIAGLWSTILDDFAAEDVALFTRLLKCVVARLDGEAAARGLA